jgi:hypothetical protein
MQIKTLEEFVEEKEKCLLKEFNLRGTIHSNWLFADYVKSKYQEYLSDAAEDLSDKVFYEKDPIILQKIATIMEKK